MNVLIVNAFGNKPSSRLKFTEFCKTIDNILKKVSFKSGIETFHYTYRTVDTIDDFIYNLPSNQKSSDDKKAEYKKNFDKLDFIFIDGKEPLNMPWLRQGIKLLYLIQLCQTTGKSLYAGGVAMLHLIYYSANGGNYRTIINSNGDYPTIEDLDKIPVEYVENLKRGETFLDFATGDLYEFTSRKEWKPINNIGIHKLIYAEKYRNRGQFVLKEYKLSKNTNLISTNKKEIKVKVLKQYCLHWFVKSIPVEFVAGTTLTWYGHNYCINSRKMQLKTLCDSNFGPIVIEHGNSIGCLFHVEKRFPETITMLHNFIANKFVLAQSKTAVIVETKRFDSVEAEKLFKSVVKDVSFGSENEYTPSNSITRPITGNARPTSKSALVNHSLLYNKISKTKKEAAHCGFGFNSREMILVKNNPVILTKIPLSSLNAPSDPTTNPTVHEISTRVLKDDYDNLRPDPNYDDEQLINFYKKQGREICEKLESFTIDNEANMRKSSKKSQFYFSAQKQRNTSLYKSNILYNTNTTRFRPQSGLNSLNSFSYQSNQIQSQSFKGNNDGNENVLTMLFPYINEDDFKIREHEPGKSNKKQLEVVRVNLERKIKSNFKEKFKKYDKELNSFGDKPSIRCSSAYMTQDEIKRKEFIESKKKWMCNEDFKKVFGKQTLAQRDKEEKQREEEEYKNETCEYKPATNYVFRTMDKTKWISNQNFIV